MLTKTILPNLPRPILRWLLRREIFVRKWLQDWLLRVAIGQAYREFEQRYPRWAASLFDEYFLRGSAAPLLARYAQPFDPPTPKELAAAWFRQLGPMGSGIVKRRLNDASWVSAEFLWLLEAELQRYEMTGTMAK